MESRKGFFRGSNENIAQLPNTHLVLWATKYGAPRWAPGLVLKRCVFLIEDFEDFTAN